MSRHVDHRCALARGFAAGALALCAAHVRSQTIADYSHAQRVLLENTMTQAATRSAGLAASAPTPVPATAASAAPRPSMTAPHAPLPPMVPVVQVSGVFATRDTAIAEVVVNATPYLLGAGQGVPGTAWHVETVDIDRVVLSRHEGVVAAVDAEAARKVFALPALPTPR